MTRVWVAARIVRGSPCVLLGVYTSRERAVARCESVNEDCVFETELDVDLQVIKDDELRIATPWYPLAL